MKPKRTLRSRDDYRHQRTRVIARRMRDVRAVLGRAEFEILKRRGALRGLEKRHFFGCSCTLCKRDKIFGVEKPKYRAKRGDLFEEIAL